MNNVKRKATQPIQGSHRPKKSRNDQEQINKKPELSEHFQPTHNNDLSPTNKELKSQKLTPLESIRYINNRLDKTAKSHFKEILEIKKFGDTPRTIISGDADGSIARPILIAIGAGIINLNEKLLDNLIYMLNEEANLLAPNKIDMINNLVAVSFSPEDMDEDKIKEHLSTIFDEDISQKNTDVLKIILVILETFNARLSLYNDIKKIDIENTSKESIRAKLQQLQQNLFNLKNKLYSRIENYNEGYGDLLKFILESSSDIISELEVYTGTLITDIDKYNNTNLITHIRKRIRLLQDILSIYNSTFNSFAPVISNTSIYKYLVFRYMQINEKIKIYITNIADGANFSHGLSPVVFMGDIIFDRFTCNIKQSMIICKKIKEHGTAVFLRGNHDYRKYKHGNNTLFAKHALESISDQEFNGLREQLNKIFVNAYYDKATETVYTHHGFYQIGPSTFITAFGEIEAFSIESFVEQLNEIDPNKFTGEQIKHFTDFRPLPSGRTVEIKFLASDQTKITVVHGHNGDPYNPTEVGNTFYIGLNSNNKFSPTAIKW